MINLIKKNIIHKYLIPFTYKIQYNLSYKIIIFIIIWIIYLELNPKIKGIWIRPNANGKKCIYLSSLFSYIINSLKIKQIWNYKFLDVNFVYATIINVIFLTILENIGYNLNLFSNK